MEENEAKKEPLANDEVKENNANDSETIPEESPQKTFISTKQMFRPKNNKKKTASKDRGQTREEKFVREDEDTVDVDFPGSMSMTNAGNPVEAVSEAAKGHSLKSSPSPVKVSLFKNRTCPKLKGRKRKKEEAAKAGKKELNYDSDSIDIDVLATYSARSFANASQTSPGAQVTFDFCNH